MCHYRLIYDERERDINAAASDKTILVTQGMLDFANDRELAVTIGHELAHNIMHHVPKDVVNTTPIIVGGGFIDGMFGLAGFDFNVTDAMMGAYTNTFGQTFEREADYVGLYLVARAGGDISAAAPFWRRMAAEHGMDEIKSDVLDVRSHPVSAERFVILEQTQKEIEDKIHKKQPLMPNLWRDYNYGKKFWWWENDADKDDYDDDDVDPEDDLLNH